MDGSKLDSRKAGAEVSWRHQQAWKTQKVYKSTNKEVLDAGLYPIAEALEVALGEGQALGVGPPRRRLSHGERYISRQTHKRQ